MGVKTLLGVSGQVNHDGGPHAGSEVGGAGVDVAEPLREGKVLARLSLDRVSHSLDATGKTGEDALDVAPFSMEMILIWSSSFTHSRKVLASLWKMPRPSGQSRSIPAAMRLRSPDTKRKWSSTSCWRTFSSIPVRG